MDLPSFTSLPSSGSERRPCYAPNRSCENCRSSKVRCLPGDSEVTDKCERCFRLNKECIHALPTRRKPRKKTETKVAELQREVRALSLILKRQQGQSTEQPTSDPEQMQVEERPPEFDFAGPLEGNLEKPSSADSQTQDGFETQNQHRSDEASGGSKESAAPTISSISTPGNAFNPSRLVNATDDVLSSDMAEKIFSRFRNELLPDYPMLAFPPTMTATELKNTRPALYLAVQTAAAGTFDENLTGKLHKQLISFLAEEIVINGAKSLDHLQSLLVTTVWYFPPDRFEQLKYVQFSAMAAGIAMELKLGLIKKDMSEDIQKKSLGNVDSVNPPEDQSSAIPVQNENSLEIARTLVATYVLCAGISYQHRRPSILPFAGRLSECLTYLESSPLAVTSDRRLCSLARLQRLMEESVLSIDVDNGRAEAEFTTPRMQLLLKSFDRQLLKLQAESIPPACNYSLEIMFHVARTHLHEIALHSDKNVDDFRPPYTIERITRRYPPRMELSPAHIDSMLICLSSTHSALELFLNTDIEALQGSPTFIFVYTMYCIVILLKLSAATSEPTNPLAQLLDHESIQVFSYLESLLAHMQSVAGKGKCRIASKFSLSLVALRRWFSAKDETSDELIEPLRHLNVEPEKDEPLASRTPPKDAMSKEFEELSFYPHFAKDWRPVDSTSGLNGSETEPIFNSEDAEYRNSTMDWIFNTSDFSSFFDGQEQFDSLWLSTDDSVDMNNSRSYQEPSFP